MTNISFERLANVCVDNNWLNKGTYKDCVKMFRMLFSGSMIYEIADFIQSCSDGWTAEMIENAILKEV